MTPQPDSTPSTSTFIGIAFYTSSEFPTQWVIVLSSCRQFNRDLWCGTIINSVNGWAESWRPYNMGLQTFAPHLFYSGLVVVGEINDLATNIIQTISNLPWKAADARSSGCKYPPTDEYVRQVFFYLDQGNIISLPPCVKSNFTHHIGERLSLLQGYPRSNINQTYSISII